MKKTKRNVIAAVSATAMMGMLSIGMVKVIDANNEANKVYASTQAADTEFAQARLDFKAKQLEVNTDQTVSKRLNLENVVKVNPRKDLQSDRLEKDALELEKTDLEKKNALELEKTDLEKKNALELESKRLKKNKLELEKNRLESDVLELEKSGLEKDALELESKRLEKNALELEKNRLEKDIHDLQKNIVESDVLELENTGRFDEYLELNGVKTPEELASLGPDKFFVDEAEWAAAKMKWLEMNPGYTEEDADNARGEYETSKWLEILEDYGIHPADNEKGWEYIGTLEEDI